MGAAAALATLLGAQPFVPAPRAYRGNMCGTRLVGLPPIPGGAADPSLVITWLAFLYPSVRRQQIYAQHRERGYLDFLVSWPDFQDAGGLPSEFTAHCQEIVAAGLRPAAMLSAKPTSSAGIRSIEETLANILLVLPLLVGLVPRFCPAWEAALWMSPADLQFLIDAIVPVVLAQPETKLYVHLKEGAGSWQPDGTFFAAFWNVNVGKLCGLWHEKILAQTPDEYRYASGGLVDILIRFAGNAGCSPDSGFGHPFDLIALEISAQTAFDGTTTEAQGDALGQWAIETPAQSGPASSVGVLGSGNGH